MEDDFLPQLARKIPVGIFRVVLAVLLHNDLGAPGCLQFVYCSDMVEVAVGQQDFFNDKAPLLRNFFEFGGFGAWVDKVRGAVMGIPLAFTPLST